MNTDLSIYEAIIACIIGVGVPALKFLHYKLLKDIDIVKDDLKDLKDDMKEEKKLVHERIGKHKESNEKNHDKYDNEFKSITEKLTRIITIMENDNG